VPLYFARFEMGRVFAKMFFGIIFFGGLSAFAMIPALLTLVGPEPNTARADEVETAEKVEMAETVDEEKQDAPDEKSKEGKAWEGKPGHEEAGAELEVLPALAAEP